MSILNFPCRRICCCRKSSSLTTNTDNESISSINPNDLIVHDKTTHENISSMSSLASKHDDIDLHRLNKECLEAINEYRFHLGFSSLELSPELINRATHRATQLSTENSIENTSQIDLIHNNELIGETILSCRAPISNGYMIAKLIHDQLIMDLKTSHSSKKRYTPILNSACQFLGFGLIRNEEKMKDFIVIYYYPMKKIDD